MMEFILHVQEKSHSLKSVHIEKPMSRWVAAAIIMNVITACFAFATNIIVVETQT